MDHISQAVPLLLVAIGVELIIGALRGRRLYRLGDSIASLSCGVVQQLVGVLNGLVGFSIYNALYAFTHFLPLAEHGRLTWLLAFAGIDFLYYWFHRASHRVSIIWGAHAPHHQSEEFNLSTGLRAGSVESWFVTLFYLPLALLGVPPLPFWGAHRLVMLYQFSIHTRLIGRLGPLEWVFVTPSHHRVHHGKNPAYIDKNYGAILIVWDRLFGTFADETEEVVYGTVHPLRSWNPLWANIEYWLSVARQMWQTRRWKEKLRLWFMPPGWDPEHPEALPEIPAVSAATYVKYDPAVPTGLRFYGIAQFLPVLVALAAFVNGPRQPTGIGLAALLFGVVVTLVTLGGTLEAKPWARSLEPLRLLMLAGGIWLIPDVPRLTAALMVAAIVVSGVWLARYRATAATSMTPV